MKSKQVLIKSPSVTSGDLKPVAELRPGLVLVFGDASRFSQPGFGASIRDAFPSAIVIGCSTAGEISSDGVFDQTLVVTGIQLSKGRLEAAFAELPSMDGSLQAGRQLGRKLREQGAELRSIFVLGQGVNVNGSDLIKGIQEEAGTQVVVTGGLAGDGGKFEKTFTLLGGEVSSSRIVAFGVYGKGLSVSYGSMGGWAPFGPVRRVTRAEKNVLFELDGQPALEIYRSYLGEQAKNLPASGLLFPFAILNDDHDQSGLIRTILGIDEKSGSLTLAGDIPQNGLVRLMHADPRGLVAGAEAAARAAAGMQKRHSGTGVAILVSCVGRKLVMGSDVDEEVGAVQEMLESGSVVTGFYSYGEICPLHSATDSKLHNQTMTITYFDEEEAA